MSHSRQSAEPDARGQVVWVYEGEDILMEASDQRLTSRRYTDELPGPTYTRHGPPRRRSDLRAGRIVVSSK